MLIRHLKRSIFLSRMLFIEKLNAATRHGLPNSTAADPHLMLQELLSKKTLSSSWSILGGRTLILGTRQSRAVVGGVIWEVWFLVQLGLGCLPEPPWHHTWEHVDVCNIAFLPFWPVKKEGIRVSHMCYWQPGVVGKLQAAGFRSRASMSTCFGIYHFGQPPKWCIASALHHSRVPDRINQHLQWSVCIGGLFCNCRIHPRMYLVTVPADISINTMKL